MNCWIARKKCVYFGSADEYASCNARAIRSMSAADSRDESSRLDEPVSQSSTTFWATSIQSRQSNGTAGLLSGRSGELSTGIMITVDVRPEELFRLTGKVAYGRRTD